jgi:hypothetical protein
MGLYRRSPLFPHDVVLNEGLSSGVAKFFGARGEESQWPPLREIMNFKQLAITY